MKILYCLLLTLALNCQAELKVNFNEKNPVQIFSGQQPLDKATKFFTTNVGIAVTNTYKGIAIILGYEFKCDGDTDFIKRGQGKFFNAKSADLNFGIDSPQRFDQWPGSPIDSHLCTMYWRGEAVGTTVNTSYSWGISLTGTGVDIGYTIASSFNIPVTSETKLETDIFYMLKDSDCW